MDAVTKSFGVCKDIQSAGRVFRVIWSARDWVSAVSWRNGERQKILKKCKNERHNYK